MFATEEKIDSTDIYYHRERTRNRVYAQVVALFYELSKDHKLTKLQIARRLGREPAQITRWLTGPGNWTLDTVSDLLLAMGAEIDPKTIRLEDREAAITPHPLTPPSSNVIDLMEALRNSRSARSDKPTPTLSGTSSTSVLSANLK